MRTTPDMTDHDESSFAAPGRAGHLRRPGSFALTVALLAGAGLIPWSPAAGQAFLDEDGGEVLGQNRIMEREYRSDSPLVNYEGRYVVVHLAENRVFVFEEGDALWSAPAGTGTGFRLETDQHQWKFSTPRGLMRIRRMEKDPVWEAPDWHFIEKGLPVPPDNHPSRKIRGAMGNTAIYLGDGIAIHGTDRPGLLLNPDPEARRVSHGCIRLTDEHARELLHMVEVGTPVLIF